MKKYRSVGKFIRHILYNEDGFIFIFALLIMFPIFIFSMSNIVNYTNMVTFSDEDTSEGLALACKDAAMQVDSKALANGLVRVKSDLALQRFQKTLAANLGYDETSFNPKPGSAYVSKPKYWVLVYNGYNDYQSNGSYPARLYYFDGNSLTISDVSFGGFPYTFTVSNTGITVGSGGTRRVTLTTPGVIAVIQHEGTRVTGDKQLNIVRWAAARVVCKDGTCKVI